MNNKSFESKGELEKQFTPAPDNAREIILESFGIPKDYIILKEEYDYSGDPPPLSPRHRSDRELWNLYQKGELHLNLNNFYILFEKLPEGKTPGMLRGETDEKTKDIINKWNEFKAENKEIYEKLVNATMEVYRLIKLANQARDKSPDHKASQNEEEKIKKHNKEYDSLYEQAYKILAVKGIPRSNLR